MCVYMCVCVGLWFFFFKIAKGLCEGCVMEKICIVYVDLSILCF